MKQSKQSARKQTKSAATLRMLWALLFVLALGIAAFFLLRPAPQLELPYNSATAVAVMDVNTGRLIHEEEADSRHSPASLTKLMTLLLVLDDIEAGKLDWEDSFTMTPLEAHTPGSKLGVSVGEVLTVRQLVAGTAMASGCDCVQALVQMTAGSESAFVERMNAKAKKLDLTNTAFVNATGIDTEGHYTCARDLATLSSALIEAHPVILEFTSQSVLEIGHRTFTNTHGMVGYDPRIQGLKTGTTLVGGYSLITYAVDDEDGYLVVLLNATDNYARLKETQTIVDLLFEEVDHG